LDQLIFTEKWLTQKEKLWTLWRATLPWLPRA